MAKRLIDDEERAAVLLEIISEDSKKAARLAELMVDNSEKLLSCGCFVTAELKKREIIVFSRKVPQGGDGDENGGVFVCDCGTNIASVVDTEKVAEYARQLRESFTPLPINICVQTRTGTGKKRHPGARTGSYCFLFTANARKPSEGGSRG